MRTFMGIATVAAAALATVASPGRADVKAGVDAWGRGDWDRAVAEWRDPAVAGDADAQYNLGQAYKLGRGVKADMAQAEQWYRRAADQGHREAVDALALALFQNGKQAEALPWLEKSAARGEKRTQFVLGTMLFNGDSVTKDWPRAYGLMTQASAAGLPQASQALAQMDRYIPLQDRQRGLAAVRAGGTAVAAAPAPAPARGPQRVAATPAPSAAPVRTAAARPAPAPTPAAAKPAAPAAPAVRDGGWRVQLGAFRDAGNARDLWQTVSGKSALAGRQPFYPKAGAVTRLQVGPFASSAEAGRACAAIRPQACVPTRK